MKYSTQPIFYVYIYADPTTKQPFYVGKGKNHRYLPKRHLSEENKFLVNVLNKVGVDNVKVAFAKMALTEEEALKLEKTLIEKFGRGIVGTGTLTNITAGGRGSCGRPFSQASREKLSKSRAGFHHTKATKKRISKTILRTGMTKGNKSNSGHFIIEEGSDVARIIVDKYTIEKLSCKKISALTNIGPGVILSFLHRNKIPTRNARHHKNQSEVLCEEN